MHNTLGIKVNWQALRIFYIKIKVFRDTFTRAAILAVLNAHLTIEFTSLRKKMCFLLYFPSLYIEYSNEYH